MTTLILIGLAGGLITGVSPCVLPMLPVIFFTSGTSARPTGDTGQRRDLRPLIIIGGIVTSFSVFTLAGSTLLSALGLPDDFLRVSGVVVLGLVGLGMVVPQLGHLLERPFYRLPKVAGTRGGPFLLGLGLGTLYVPCAGPILAAITVAGATGQVGLRTVVLTVSFAIGAAVPLLVFAAAGANIRTRINAYRERATLFRTSGGVVLVVLALALAFDVTSVLQRAVPNYTRGLEDTIAQSEAVQGALSPFESAENRELSRCTPGAAQLGDCGAAPPLRGTGRWFNTAGGRELSLSELRGRVVLLDFFAYSCINCQRDQPYIQRWASTYEAAGLSVIGIHSPEFAFERDADNLADSLEREGTTYPVVQDNDLATWTAYRNRYWPAKYLVDRDGSVRAITFGEGGYRRTEQLIRELLDDGNRGDLPAPVTDVEDETLTRGRTPELQLADNKPGYVGAPRYVQEGPAAYTFVERAQPRDTYGLSGRWSATREYLEADQDAAVRLHYRARGVYHVLAGQGTVTLSRQGAADRILRVSGAPHLYSLVEQDEVTEGVVTLTYSPGVRAYNFTFG